MSRNSTQQQTRRRIALVANHPAMNKNMLRWAHILGQDGLWEPVVFSISGNLAALAEQMRIARDVAVFSPPPGIGWTHFDARGDNVPAASAEAPPAPASRKTALMQSARRGLQLVRKPKWLQFVLRVVRGTRNLRRQVNHLVRFFREEEIAAVLLSESSPVYDAPVFIHAARRAGIPVVTVPIDHYGRQDHAEMYLTETSLHAGRGINKWVARLYPKWAVTYRDIVMLRMPADAILAQEFAGLGSPDPWRMVGAWEDAAAVSGEAMRKFFHDEGVAPGLLRLVGNPELDLIAASMKRGPRELLESAGIAGDKPIILTALIADHFLEGRPEAEHQSFLEIVQAWVRPLGEIRDFQVVVSLHPSQSIADYRYIEQWGVKIYTGDVIDLIPHCRIFVACSSTARLALACAKPIVYYDVYRYTENTPSISFGNAGGTFVVLDNASYRGVLTRLAEDPESYREAVAEQARIAERSGKLDGNSGRRLAGLLEELLTRRETAAPHGRQG